MAARNTSPLSEVRARTPICMFALLASAMLIPNALAQPPESETQGSTVPSGNIIQTREDCNGNGVEDAQDLADWGASFGEADSWQAFDAGDHGVGSDPDGYWGNVFDGRYIYFVPGINGTMPHGEVMRYDTQGDYSDVASWTTFDPGAHGVGDKPDGFAYAIFDGRYIYFAPHENITGNFGEVMRYDTQGEFTDVASWATFDPGDHGVGVDPDGYIGGTFDGRYVYFAPYDNGTTHHSEVLRYDTEADFQTAESWNTFDPRDHGISQEYGYAGAVYDGDYVYFVPNCTDDTHHHGEVLRYDPGGDFLNPASWLAYDPGTHGIGDDPDGYVGAIFDGQYIYFVPCWKEPDMWHCEVLRFNTEKAFDSVKGWVTFSPDEAGVGSNPEGYSEAAFDGRFIYFAPSTSDDTFNDEILRYDTTSESFYDLAAWSTARPKIQGVGDEANGFAGAAFDGRHVYFSPCRWAAPHGEVLRYDTATTGSPDCNGNGIPDECEIEDGSAADCNGNGVPDECDIAHAYSWDVDGDGVPDECQGEDCNENGIDDAQEIADWGTMFDDASSWTAFDPGDHGVGDDPDGYHDAVFDGRYLYFVPYRAEYPEFTGEVMRYDTFGEYTDPASWLTYNPDDHGVGVHTVGYAGGVYDGQYVYFVPWSRTSGYHGEVLRYDTAKDFDNVKAWTAFDPGLQGVGGVPRGYRGAIFDGQYVYFVPCYNGASFHCEMLRFDTTGVFTDAGSWTVYEPSDDGVGDNTRGYSYAALDGRYIYFGPYHNGTAYHGEVLRYDMTGDFSAAGSWTAFDPGDNGLGTDPDGYPGVVYDGRFVYFVPFNNGTVCHAEVMRYDTEADFVDIASWATFDAFAQGVVTTKGYMGGIFDGRFIVFVPLADDDGNHNETLRYDTFGAFSDASSWTSYTLPGDDLGYRGGGYDGHYVYLVPGGTYENHGNVQRYDPAVIGAPDCNDNGVPDECEIEDGSAEDCNDNGIPDECDIAHGFSWDADDDGIPDECQDDCPEDLDGSGVVDVLDLLAVLAVWGTDDPTADLVPDGIVDVLDLLQVLGAWGPC